MSTVPDDPISAHTLREAAAQIRSAGGSGGIATYAHELAGALPGAAVGGVAYDLSLGLGLWFSDLADLIDEIAHAGDTPRDEVP